MYNKLKSTVMPVIQSRIIAGIFIVIPLAVTMWLVFIFFNLITKWADPILSQFHLSDWENKYWFELSIRGFSIIVTLAFLFVVGQVAKWTLGRRLMDAFEKGILEIPVLSTIYSTAKQVVDAIKGGNGMFRQVVLVEFPKAGIYTIGFLTNENRGRNEFSEKTGKNLISVFMPFAPPTSGYIIFIPREDCIFLEMSVSDGMKLIISGGVAAPEYPYVKQKIENPGKQ
ncbi:MAG: DUF502 domain-containing protein [Victivallales bacterium]|jgi:uncharacterized membrane protein